MTALTEWGSRIARSAIAIEDVPSGPWAGSDESHPPDRIPRTHAAGVGSTNWLYLPRTGTFKRRSGQTQVFDTFGGAAVGMLPALWAGGKARQLEEFLSASVTDGVPTVMALVTKETIASGLDDGWFSNVWWRDQVGSVNRTLGSEYGATTTYPVLGSEQTYRVVPLWYESGDGGLTRGTTEYLRRFFVSGSRRFLKVGNWWYFPSVKGTPARWNGQVATEAAVATISPTSTLQTGGTAPTSWQSSTYGSAAGTGAVPAGNDLLWYQEINDRDDADYLRFNSVPTTYSAIFGLGSAISSTITTWTITYRARLSVGGPGGIGAVPADASFRFRLGRSDGFAEPTAERLIKTYYTTSMATYTETLVFTGGGNSQAINSIRLEGFTGAVGGVENGSGLDVAWVEVSATSGGTAVANRLIPSGPLPPTHAGTLTKGNVVVGGESISNTVYPDSDVTVNAWLNQASSGSNLYQSIDEPTANDLDYIQSAANTSDTCEVGLGNLGFAPASDSAVTVSFRARKASGAFALGALRVDLVKTGTVIASSTASLLTTTVTGYSFTLSDANITTIGTLAADWNDLRLRFVITSSAGGYYAQVTHAALTYTPSGSIAEGSWRGHDRFLYSVAYRFEDGSVWAPCTPRLPSTLLENGYNMFTVNPDNPTGQFDFITWSNIPIGPHGVVGRLLLRTPKVDSTVTGDELKLNPFDFRVVWELTDNSTTTYVDHQSDDFALAEDSAGLFVRYDHLMPPRARYIAGGDMRVVHAYGGRNPCAIIIAPVGRGDDGLGGIEPSFDLNLADTNATAYTSNGSYMRLRYDAGVGTFLDLVQSDGSSATNTATLNLATYNTLQKLVDQINSTNFAEHGQTWRAQLCPGANPEAPSATCLTPHYRVMSAASTTTNGLDTLTKSTGGLSVIAVGTFVSGTGITAGTYVKRIDSDTQLQISANATATGSVTPTFYTNLGDVALTGVESALSYQRVIANSLPGFLYFNESYLDDDPIDKSSVWMTTASPGSMRSAANNFSGKTSNRFKPPTNAGISMGGAAVDQGFVLPFSGAVFALKNTRDASTGIDEDYKLVELNANRGCVAWNTVTPGNRFVPYLTAEGLCCADLEREFLVSDHLFLHAPATGGIAYEVMKGVAASAADDDTAYAAARVMRSAIWFTYRSAVGAVAHPDSQVVLDFSSGHISNGLEALFRTEDLVNERGQVIAPRGSVWGWSTRLVRSLTAMCEGRRSDGGHLYGWNDSNAGSTGNGRVDEFETTDTDNGTAIAAALLFPWERMGRQQKLSAQEIILEHKAPAGSTIFLDFHRSYSDTTYTLTPSTTALVVGREVKLLPQAARVVTAACYIGYRQTAGGAAELRAFTLRAKPVPSYT